LLSIFRCLGGGIQITAVLINATSLQVVIPAALVQFNQTYVVESSAGSVCSAMQPRFCITAQVKLVSFTTPSGNACD
jgi:hypothetical protein